MPAVNPSSPVPGPDVAPAQALRLLEIELARARAQRQVRESSAVGSRLVLRTLCVLFLLALMGAGCYAFWRAEELRGEVRRVNPAAPGVPAPAMRP